ncbi:hypothetical protein K4E85_02345 [Campylobacter coli]
MHEKDFERDKGRFTTTAYGGKGTVESSEIWTLFRKIFENYAINNKKCIKIYNCTEGGARIEGTIEKPFEEICEEILESEIKKPLIKLKKKTKKNNLNICSKAIKKSKKYTTCTQFSKRMQKNS